MSGRIIIELRGDDNERVEVIANVHTSAFKECGGLFIGFLPDNDCREHLPCRPTFPAWDRKRKISELPDPPPEVR